MTESAVWSFTSTSTTSTPSSLSPLDSGTTSESATPRFGWSSIAAVIETCSSATFHWGYSGPQEEIQFVLLPETSPTSDSASLVQTGNGTTIATGIDAAALQWTWTQANASAGQYLVVALGDRIGATLPLLMLTNGTDTSCIATLAASAAPTPTFSATRLPNGTVLVGGIGGGVVAVVIAIAGYFVWRRSRRRQPWCRTDSSRREHSITSLVSARFPTLTKTGRHGPPPDLASHSPSMTNCQTPSFLEAEPCTPASASIYTPHRQIHGQGEESSEDVSIIGSSLSTPSDMTFMSALMPTTPSTYLPSYTTSVSTPPSYATKEARSVSHSPEATGSDAGSS